MEFQITEAVELIKTLAEAENLTLSTALRVFVAEAGLDSAQASELKGSLFEEYTLKEMAEDSLSSALMSVFVSHDAEDLQEIDTKETQEGTKYKVRVQDRQSGSSYVRYATREKIAELRANPNISSVEITSHGDTGEDDRGQRTAAAKTGRDYDGDGKKESSSKEHAGVVHNAIQKRMGGKPDGQDTRKEAFDPKGAARIDAAKGKKSETEDEKNKRLMLGKYSPAVRYAKKKEVEEGVDFKGARRVDDARKKEQDEKDKKSPSSKDQRLAMGKFRPGASKEERAEGGRDVMREKGTSPTKKGKKMFEEYLAARGLSEKFEVTDADEKNNTEAYKRLKAGNPAYTRAAKKKVETKDPWSTHPSDAKAHRKEDQQEEWKPDPKEKRAKKSAKIARDEEIESGRRPRDRDDDKIKDLYKRRMAVDFKKKKSQIGEDFVAEADIYDSGRENQSQRDKAKTGKKIDGKGVDNSTRVKLMPQMESVQTEAGLSAAEVKLFGGSVSEQVRAAAKAFGDSLKEECCPNCGTPECTCEGKKEEKPKKKKTKIDEAGMPILEYSRNNARPGPSKDMIDPPADEQGAIGHMNPKGKAKRYKERGEAPGDRRPNDIVGPDLPNERGTVPNGSGV